MLVIANYANNNKRDKTLQVFNGQWTDGDNGMRWTWMFCLWNLTLEEDERSIR